MSRIFGFDIGTASIGSAVIDYDPARGAGDILWLAVRIFPEARDPDGTPLNQTRRTKRLIRRQFRRRRQRRRALNEALFDASLLPAYGSTEWQAVMKMEPLALRSRGLSERLEPHELGRALYHLAKRRHFKERELAEVEREDAAEETKIRRIANSFTAEARASGLTIGQLLFSETSPDDKNLRRKMLAEGGSHKRARGIHFHRSDVADEFDRLVTAQAAFYRVLRDSDLRAHIENVVFAQRPVFWRRNALGRCRLVPDAPLCPKGSWLSQRRRMLEKLNNLTLVGDNARPLDREERDAILARLQAQASMSWQGVRAVLRPIFKVQGELGRERSIRFNLEEGGDPKLLGNAIEAKLAEIFRSKWANHPDRQLIRDAIYERLWAADNGQIGEQRVVIRTECERNERRLEAVQSFMADFGVTADEAAALSNLTLPTGWEPFSIVAIQKFLPYLESGVRFGALLNGPDWEGWRNRTFPNRERPTGESLDRLPSPTCWDEQRRIAASRNPTVIRALNELRKVVNNLISLYGKPDLIRVELARAVGKSTREREDMRLGMRRRERDRAKAEADLRLKRITQPRDADIEKWLLWKECGELDPYSGKPISFDALFGTSDFEVEHIWPRWISIDNSFANKTLCLRSLNLIKGNRTPFEAFGSGPQWKQMKTRVWGLVRDGKMKAGKAKRFCREQPLGDDFKSHQLNDTGYAARQAVTFLKRLWPALGVAAPVTVQAVTGRVTAELRRLWGLNNILSDNGEKTRADHRHHAIDALVVACAHPGMTQKLSNCWQAENDPTASSPRLDPPWKTIRADAEQAVKEIVVSHRTRRKISGPLHQEMLLGYARRNIIKNGIEYGVFAKRVPVKNLPLATLKAERLEDLSRTAPFLVSDDHIRRVLLAHVESANVQPAKAYPPYPRLIPDGPEIRKARVLTLRQKGLMVRVSTGFADPAHNHHIAMFRLPDGKIVFDPPVTLFEAAWRLSRHEPIVKRTRDDGATFVMSLSAGDALEFPAGKKAGVWIVGGVWSNGQILLERASDAIHASTTRPTPGALLREGARKISVNPIGLIRPAND